MQNKKWIRFVGSFIVLPVATMSVPAVPLSQAVINVVNTPSLVSLQKYNIGIMDLLASNQAIGSEAKLKAKTLQAEADAINAYFKAYDMPLLGTGMKMAKEAEKNGLDWRLLPAIAIRESTGGKHDCKRVDNNHFGWGSCKISFSSNDEAIETVAKNLGGNNPNTARHYEDKTTEQILRAYNPPYVVPRYVQQVMSIMKAIGDTEITITANA